jgi:hypothetical protein
LDLPEISSAHLKAGREYLDALGRLGLVPDGLCWAYDRTIEQFALVLVTTHFDYVGPHEIYRLLTKAYNVSATPQEISPFLVRLHSPKQRLAKTLLRAFATKVRLNAVPKGEPTSERDITDEAVHVEVGDLIFRQAWVYGASRPKSDSVERSRQWRRFAETVEKLAA